MPEGKIYEACMCLDSAQPWFARPQPQNCCLAMP